MIALTRRSEASDRAAFDEAFAALPAQVRRDPYRVGLVPDALWLALLSADLPAAFWLAEVDGAPVGRIGASCSPVHAGVGAVGFFELDLERSDWREAAEALLAAASGWLRAQGAERAHGPLCFNTWFPYRFRTDPHPEQFVWEPVNPPEYPACFEAHGFALDMPYASVAVEGLEEISRLTAPAHERALTAGYTFRPFDRERLAGEETALLHAIAQEAFAGEAYLLEPISLPAFRQIYVPLVTKADVRPSSFVLDPTGEPVGFLFSFPDPSQGEPYLVCKSIAVLPSARGEGLSNALWHRALQVAIEQGIDRAVLAMVRVGAQSESYAKKGRFLWQHDYALYRKEL